MKGKRLWRLNTNDETEITSSLTAFTLLFIFMKGPLDTPRFIWG
jgi:hypothetical protein